MCYKKLCFYTKAKRDYTGLQMLFAQKENDQILKFVISLILLPIAESRIQKFNTIENLVMMSKYFNRMHPKKKAHVFKNYLTKEGTLNVEDYGLFISRHLVK